MKLQQSRKFVAIWRNKTSSADVLEIRAQKPIRDTRVPAFSPRSHVMVFYFCRGHLVQRGELKGKCSIVKGAQHPSDVLQGTALDAAFRYRPRRLAFKVDDHKVGSSVQNLAKVIIAVNTSAHRLDRMGERRVISLQDLVLPSRQVLCFLT